MLHRSALTSVLLPVTQGGEFTSACNVRACSLAVEVRAALHAVCSTPLHCIAARHILAVMLESSVQSDWDDATQRRYPIVHAHSLFARLRDPVGIRGLCAELSASCEARGLRRNVSDSGAGARNQTRR